MHRTRRWLYVRGMNGWENDPQEGTSIAGIVGWLRTQGTRDRHRSVASPMRLRQAIPTPVMKTSLGMQISHLWCFFCSWMAGGVIKTIVVQGLQCQYFISLIVMCHVHT